MPDTYTSPTDLEQALRAYIAEGSGLAGRYVIPGNDRGTSPKSPYATVLALNHWQVGTQILHQLPAPLFGTTSLQYMHSTYSVQWFYDAAEVNALAFSLWHQTEFGLTAAEKAGFRLDWPLHIDRLDVPFGDGWERRMRLDLGLQWAYSAAQDTGSLEPGTSEICYDDIVVEITPGG